MELFGSGISVNTGFDLGSARPLDSRTWVQTHKEMVDMPAIRKFVNLKTYVADDKAQYRWTGTEWILDQSGLKSGSGSPAVDYGNPGDMYIDSDNGDVWYLGYDDATNSMKWVLLFNMQGAGGDQGPVGPQGVRGSLWSTGTMITGTSSVGSVFPNSGIAQSNIKDLYLNISTGYVYECTKAGNPATAEWIYVTSIMGPRGEQGEKGLTGDTGERGERGERGLQGTRGTNTIVIDANYETTPTDMVLPGVAGSGIMQNDQAINRNYGHLFTALSDGDGDTVKWRRVAVVSGAKIYIGNKLSTSGTADISVPESGLPYTNAGDIYINNETGQLFVCIIEGVPKYSTWRPNGTLVIGSAINDILGNKIVSYIRNITASNNILSITHGDGTIDEVPIQYPIFQGGSISHNGKSGLVPPPIATTNIDLLFLNANGSWESINTMSATTPGVAKLGNTLTISSEGVLDTKAHTHTQSQIDGLENRLNQMQEDIDSKPDASTGTIENAKTANKLKNPVNVQISGGVTADPVQFDGSADLNLVVNSVDTSKLKGTIDPKNLPASAIPTLKIVESEEAMLQLTINDIQNGDLVQIDTVPAVIYYVVDDTKLDSMNGYRQLTAGAASSVPWTGITGKPDVYPPDSHTHNESDVNGLTDKLSLMQTDIENRYKKTDVVEKAMFDQHGNSLLDKISDLRPIVADNTLGLSPAMRWTTYATNDDGDKLTITKTSFLMDWIMNGTDDAMDGMEGFVPQPKAGDMKKVLAGSGKWVEIPIPKYQDIVIKTTDWTKSTGSEVFTCDVVCDTVITDDTIITLIPVAEAENLKQIWYSFVIGVGQDNSANTIKFQAQYQPTADVKYKLQFVKYYE